MIILINFEKFLSNYHNMNILCGIAAVFWNDKWLHFIWEFLVFWGTGAWKFDGKLRAFLDELDLK
jgi:hypothetical protein